MKNIVLIGMPGAGKSTVGVILAKALRRHFHGYGYRNTGASGRLVQEIVDTNEAEASRSSRSRQSSPCTAATPSSQRGAAWSSAGGRWST